MQACRGRSRRTQALYTAKIDCRFKLGLFCNSRCESRAFDFRVGLSLLLVPLSQPHPGAAAVLVDELDARNF
jgi:hypothetical protein